MQLTETKQESTRCDRNKSLRILMMSHMPWSRDLGGPRILIELAAQLQNHGCRVDKFDIDDAFPRKTKLTRLLGVALFHRRAIAHARNHGGQYDVIQAEQGNLPCSKKYLRFPGLLVAHSVGLAHFNERARKADGSHGSTQCLTRRLKNRVLCAAAERISGGLKAVNISFQAADKIILLNKDECDFVRNTLGHGNKAVFFPGGLTEERAKALVATAGSPKIRLSERLVVFIGRWDTLKGSRDFPALVRRIRQCLPATRFLLLGTGLSELAILPQFDPSDRENISIIPSFPSDELPSFLSRCTAGVFPSYTEGFGLAVLEKLASGIPCVSYNIPGPREMLSEIVPDLMVSLGDVETLAKKVVAILQMPVSLYANLSSRCITVAGKYRWEEIGQRAFELYRRGVAELRRSNENEPNIPVPLESNP
jgi:glycosyltransferase involved in cell wall biosynthesis